MRISDWSSDVCSSDLAGSLVRPLSWFALATPRLSSRHSLPGPMPAAGKDAIVVGRRPVPLPVGPRATPRDDSGVYGRCDPARGLPPRLPQPRRVPGVPALAVGGHGHAGLVPHGGLVGCSD